MNSARTQNSLSTASVDSSLKRRTFRRSAGRGLLLSVLLLAQVTFASLAFAQERERDLVGTVALPEAVHYVLAYKESEMWRLQVIEHKYGELQRTVRSEYFQTRQQAAEAHRQSLAALEALRPPPPPSQGGEDGDEADAVVVSEDALALPVAHDNGTSIWPVTQAWNDQWFQKFSAWVAKDIDKNYFARYQLRTDCADVIISLYWIFAREHGLPVAVTLSGSGQMVGHMTMPAAWRNLPTAKNWYEDQRFLTALDYVLDNTYTRSLSRDSYPIRISRDSLIPGTHHLEFHERGGHAMLVKKVTTTKETAKILTWNSTLPRKVRALFPKDYIFGDQATYGNGFLRLKWPVREDSYWTYLEDDQYPQFSEQQYAPEFMNGKGTFSSAVFAQLSGNTKFDMKDWQATLSLLGNYIKLRANAVYEGHAACQKIDCSPGSEGWEEWSTPGRDSTLLKIIRGSVKAVELNSKNKEALRLWSEFLKKKVRYADQGKSLSHHEVIESFMEGRFRSDPRLSIEERWGLK